MKKTSLILILSGLALSAASCSLFKKTQQETFNSGDAIPLYPVATSTSADLSLGGHWYIKTVGAIELRGIDDEEWPFIEFVPAEARFYGQDGCNIINGSYRIDGGNSLQLSQLASTRKLCQGDSLAYPIANALNRTAGFTVATQSDGTSLLNLVDSAQKTVMTLRKSDIDFLNGAWQVKAVNGKPIDVDQARLVFDVDANTVSGNAGCNRLMGEISRNPRVSAALQLTNLATTRMTCPDIQTESQLLIALEEVTTAKRKNDSTVELLDAAGHSVVTLHRLSKEDLKNE
ncbi:MAG: META domain-containing protein [Muribaculaceae bacterium]|nr:META domain-containing protein [Muribaculaceae bacterium]